MTEPQINTETIKELVRLGRLTAGPQVVPGGNVPYVIVPDGCTAQPLPDLVYNEYERHEAQPKRIIGTISVLDPESFVQYFGDFSNPDSRIFAYEPESKVIGILDYHENHESEGPKPHWCQHRVALTLRHSEPWKAWTAQNNKHVTQQQFAEFLEQNAFDIIRPSPAEIMEVARDLQATTEVEFGGGVRSNGAMNFKYTETTKATVGAGQLSVPERFTIQIPCYVGGFVVPMDALLRFRLKEGKLEIWFSLIRPDEVARQAFIGSRDQIAKTLSIDILNGTPAA